MALKESNVYYYEQTDDGNYICKVFEEKFNSHKVPCSAKISLTEC